MKKNVAELKQDRKALREQRNPLGVAVKERDLTPDEQASFDALTAQIDALTKRIEVLEKVEDEDDEEETEEVEEDGDDTEEEAKPRKAPKKGSERLHLRFNIQSSKTRKDSHEYSLSRALALHVKGRDVDGLEGERSQELERNYGTPAKGFYLDLNTKARGRHRNVKHRDFSTTTGAGGVGVLVEPNLIDLLRARMVCDQLGVEIHTDLHGKFALPRINGASQMYFIGEGQNVTGSNMTLDQVNFTPRTAAVKVPVTRKAMFEVSVDAITAVENDMMKVLAIGLDTQVLAGDGVGADPTGILYDSNVPVITLAADTAGNGGAMSYADALKFETVLSQGNADRGSIGWVTTPAVRGKLKQTPKINAGQVYPEFVWAPDNTVNGYQALVTTEMPGAITKGSGTNLSSIIFGNFEDAILALWAGVDVWYDPYSQGDSGAVIIRLMQEMDTQRRHPQSFVIATDVSTA